MPSKRPVPPAGSGWARRRRRYGSRSPAARWGCRCSSPSKSSAATARWPGCARRWTGWRPDDVLDLLLVLRYRKAVTYGHHVLLAALEEHPTTTRYEVRFATDVDACVRAIREASA